MASQRFITKHGWKEIARNEENRRGAAQKLRVIYFASVFDHAN